MSASASTIRRAAARMLGAAAGTAAALTVLLLILFLTSVLFGGFRWATPMGTLSCRHPGRLLLGALLATGVWRLFRHPRPEAEAPPSSTPFASAGAGWWLVGLSLLIGLRFLYRAYEPCLGGRALPSVSFPAIHLLFLVSTLNAWAAWMRLRSEHGLGAWCAGFFLALSPLWFHVSTPVTIGYTSAFLAWLLPWPARKRASWWLPLSGLLLLAATLLGSLGWAGRRMQENLLERAAPGLLVWLALAGLAAWWLTRRRPRPWLPPLVTLAFWGLILSGARGEAGVLGAVLMLPLLSALVAIGLAGLLAVGPLPWRNVIMIGTAGILIGYARDGLDRSIRSPFAPREPAPVEAPRLQQEEAPE